MIFKLCAGCQKKKMFVKKRKFYSKTLHTDLTSNNEICRRCLKAYAHIKEPKMIGYAHKDIALGEEVYDFYIQSTLPEITN